MYLKVIGADVVVLNSSEVIADLLDKRSAIYSDKVITSPIEGLGFDSIVCGIPPNSHNRQS
jgi:hypothetical protein